MTGVDKCRCNHFDRSHINGPCQGHYINGTGGTDPCDCAAYDPATPAERQHLDLMEGLVQR